MVTDSLERRALPRAMLPSPAARPPSAILAHPRRKLAGNIFPWRPKTLEKPGADGMAYPMLGEIPDMITAIPFQFRSRLAFGGEILAQQATFLPVAPARSPDRGTIYTPETRHLAGFLPIFNFNRKNLTVAQPLLKETLR